MMKMKKLLSLILAGSLVAGMSLTSMAATGFNPPAQENNTVEFDAADPDENPTEETVPVYGYVGPDTILDDKDPKDSDKKPEPEEPDDPDPKSTEINVSVPVKILWAAFEGDGTSDEIAITSPAYYIRNNSADLQIAVDAVSFVARNDADNAEVDPYWAEPLTVAGDDLAHDMKLGDSERSLGNLKADEQMNFEITGVLDYEELLDNYDMENDGYLQPAYDLTLRIKAL